MTAWEAENKTQTQQQRQSSYRKPTNAEDDLFDSKSPKKMAQKK